MANVKVKFRKSTVEGKKGTVYYQICHAGCHVNISTKYKVADHEWDAFSERVRVTDADSDAEHYNQRIENDLSVISVIISDLESSMLHYTVNDISARFKHDTNAITVLQYVRKRIAELESDGHFGTALNYKSALNSFMRFVGNDNVSMSIFNYGIVYRYSRWLMENHISRNSVSFYMRVLRAVYNTAVKEKLVVQTYPFADVYTGVDRTRKRALSEDTLKRLFSLQINGNRKMCLVRDLFLFSYCMRGMAFVDIVYLQKHNIHGSCITYRRRKTSQTISVRIEPCISKILKKYENDTKDSPYVFPVITADNEKDAYRQYRIAIVKYNRMLKTLAQMAGISANLSSYTSRHSWATAARNHNIPISVISAGMGHSSQLTTEIYLASIDNSVIDKANRRLLKDMGNLIL